MPVDDDDDKKDCEIVILLHVIEYCTSHENNA